jgi:hypothetical protein
VAELQDRAGGAAARGEQLRGQALPQPQRVPAGRAGPAGAPLAPAAEHDAVEEALQRRPNQLLRLGRHLGRLLRLLRVHRLARLVRRLRVRRRGHQHQPARHGGQRL